MIPHRNPSFLIDKSSPKQIKTPGSPPGVFIWGQPSAAGVTPHCAGAASPRRGHSEPGSPSPPTASMKSSGAALFETCGPAMDCPARQFLPGACPPPLCRRVLPAHAKRPHTMAGSFSIPAKAGELPRCHRSHRVSGCPSSPTLPAGYFLPTQKGPAQRRSLFLFRQEPDQLRFRRQSMVKG